MCKFTRIYVLTYAHLHPYVGGAWNRAIFGRFIACKSEQKKCRVFSGYCSKMWVLNLCDTSLKSKSKVTPDFYVQSSKIFVWEHKVRLKKCFCERFAIWLQQHLNHALQTRPSRYFRRTFLISKRNQSTNRWFLFSIFAWWITFYFAGVYHPCMFYVKMCTKKPQLNVRFADSGAHPSCSHSSASW